MCTDAPYSGSDGLLGMMGATSGPAAAISTLEASSASASGGWASGMADGCMPMGCSGGGSGGSWLAEAMPQARALQVCFGGERGTKAMSRMCKWGEGEKQVGRRETGLFPSLHRQPMLVVSVAAVAAHINAY